MLYEYGFLDDLLEGKIMESRSDTVVVFGTKMKRRQCLPLSKEKRKERRLPGAKLEKR